MTIKPKTPGQFGQLGQLGRLFEGSSPFHRVGRFVTDHVALPELTACTIAAWVLASWQVNAWDKFPHLAITSPEKRCGKTTLLELLALVCPRAMMTSNISPAVLYRVIEDKQPTLLFDEAQSLTRRGSEASEVTRELLNASINKNAHVFRAALKDGQYVPVRFRTYCPKVFALIGSLDSVLADRSLPVEMRRKTSKDTVQRYRSRLVEPLGKEVQGEIKEWAEGNLEEARSIYDDLEPFDIENDRMAELLMPLQAVLLALGDLNAYDALEQYAFSLEERDKREEMQSPGVMLLAACREIFDGNEFLLTKAIIASLEARTWEPWSTWSSGRCITERALSLLLGPFDIKPKQNREKTKRGYFASSFREAWARYLPDEASETSEVSKALGSLKRPKRPNRPEDIG